MNIYWCAPYLKKFGWGIIFVLGLIGIIPFPGMAQITPDDTLGNERSRVNRNVPVRGGNADRIEGGATRGSNLFHSFQEFNVNEGQRVYFANPSGIANILSRVTGRDVSDIMGTLGVEGGANLFLLNPNGIIFGPNARLDISGSFFSSTADSFTFPDGTQFSATNPGDSSLLSVNVPMGVQYGPNAPGAISNAGTLSVGQNFRLSGGSVTSTGLLSAPSGQLLVEGVAGDVQVRNAAAQTATFAASNSLLLQESQLQTAGDLNLFAGNTVQVRDSVVNPFIAQAGGDLTVQGNQSIDILALNHPQTPFVSGGNLSLISDGIISGDAHFYSGGGFSILNLAGEPGSFVSLHDPIISASGDVTFGDYTGAALKVESLGSITAGNITINNPDTTLAAFCAGNPCSDDAQILAQERALILRAGLPELEEVNFPYPDTILSRPPTTINGTDFTETNISRQPLGSIQVGNINTSVATGNAGRVILSAPGNITAGNISTFVGAGGIGNGGNITLTSTGGSINTTAGELISVGSRGGGDVTIEAFGDIRIATVRSDVGVGGDGVAGNVALTSNSGSIFLDDSNINADSINSDYNFGYSTISIEALQGSVSLDNSSVSTRNFGSSFAGDIFINASDIINIIDSTISSEGNFGRIFIGESDFSNTPTSPQNVSINGSTLSTTNSGITGADDYAINAGDISINAVNSITLTNRSRLETLTVRRGNAGDITLNAGTPGTSGNTGNITIGTPTDTPVASPDATQILARSLSGGGNAGSITISATNTVMISARNDPSIASDVAGGTGNGNNLIITARSIEINNGSIVAASILSGGADEARAGDIDITATERVAISDNSVVFSEIGPSAVGNGGTINISAPIIFLDGSSVNTQIRQGGRGQAGNIVISAPQLLRVRNGGQLSTLTLGIGNAGNITINGQNVIFNGQGENRWSRNTFIREGNLDRSGVFASVESTATGDAGDITINTPQLTLRNGAIVSAQTLSSGQGGSIFLSPNLNGRSLRINLGRSSQISASTSSSGQGGDISITVPSSATLSGGGELTVETTGAGQAGQFSIATEQLNVRDGTRVSAETSSSGGGGSISLRPHGGRSLTVDIDANSEISAATNGSGRGGDMLITAPDSVTLTGGGTLTVETTRTDLPGGTRAGQAGQLSIETERLNVDGTQVLAQAIGTGAAGDLTINAREVTVENGASISVSNDSSRRRNNAGTFGNISLEGLDALVVRDGGEITASTRRGRAGSVTIDANESVEVSEEGSRIAVEATGDDGVAGGLTIRTDDLTVNNSGEITASATTGEAGGVEIDASESVEVSEEGSRIAARATGEGGSAGDLTIRTDDLTVNNSGEITASATTGEAGGVEIDASESVEVSGEGSRIAARATGEGGSAGDLTITTGDLTIQDGAEVTVDSQGVAGDLDITANSIELDDGEITAIAGAGNLGNITINLSGTLLQLYNGSQISAGGEEGGSGGDLTINAENGFVLADPYGDSDILANAEQGRGGDIEITTNAIFGLEERNPRTRLSDINAASEFSTGGNIVLNTLQIDPTRGLGELPIDIVDASSLVAEGCIGSNRSGVEDQGEFTRTGRGGLSPDPTALLMDESLIEQIATHQNEEPDAASSDAPETASESLVEAQGLARNANGKVSLVSNSSTSTVTSPVFTPNTCDAP